MSIKAEIVLDSISPQMKRLTTFKLRYPKFIHGEFMTHRVFSRNASSSRAIPVTKYLDEVSSDVLRAKPISWGQNQKGMQASKDLDAEEASLAEELWERAAQHAVHVATLMHEKGVHKQLANRILEPFVHINVVCTATEYNNFFGLRLDAGAQPEIRELAKEMWKCLQDSKPKLLDPGGWHLPFITEEDRRAAQEYADATISASHPDGRWVHDIQLLIRVSVARCARTSYESFETGKRSTVKEDLELYDRLLSGKIIHASPAEHQATPDSIWDVRSGRRFENQWDQWQKPEEHGNFVGWRQYRKMLKGENCAPLPDEYLAF